MNLRLPYFPGVGHKKTGGLQAGLSQTELVAPLTKPHRIGFAMVSTLAQDERRMGPHHGALPKKEAFLTALQSNDLRFTEAPQEAALYFQDKDANIRLRAAAEKFLATMDYLVFFAVTYEAMAGNTNLFQDTLKPRLYEKHGRLVKRMEECHWSSDTMQCELETFIGALARAIRMEMRGIIRRFEMEH